MPSRPLPEINTSLPLLMKQEFDLMIQSILTPIQQTNEVNEINLQQTIVNEQEQKDAFETGKDILIHKYSKLCLLYFFVIFY
jgi:hypothetical protein